MQSKPENVYTYLFAILLALYTLSNVVWLICDDTPPISDSVYYIQGSQTLIQSVQNEGILGLRSIPDLVPYRPPLQSIMGTAALTLLGPEPVNVLYLNVIWLSLTAWLVYGLIQRLVNPAAGIIAAVFLMSNALVHGYLTMYETEVPMMAVVMGSYYCVMEVRRTGSQTYMVILGFLLCAGMLLKWIFFLILFGPVLYLLVDLYRKKVDDGNTPNLPNIWRMLLCVALPPVILVLPWYIYKLDDLLAYKSNVAKWKFYTVFVEGWDWRLMMYYPSLQFLKLHWIHTLVLAGCFILFCLYGLRPIQKKITPFLLNIVLSWGIFWLYFIFNPTNIPQKYLLPLQPLSAVGIGLLCTGIPAGWRRYVVIALVIVFTGVHVYQDWGVFASNSKLYEGEHSQQFLEPQTGFFEYPIRRPRDYNLPHKELSGDIQTALGSEERPVKVFVLPWLQRFNSFFLSVWFNTVIEDVTTTGVTKYNIINEMLSHDFMVTSTGPAHSEMIHRDRMDPYRHDLTILIARALASEPDWFIQSHKFLQSYEYRGEGEIIRLYQRTKAVTPDEAQYVIGLLMDALLEQPSLWVQINITWRLLNNDQHLNRSQLLSHLYQGEALPSLQKLADQLKYPQTEWYPYERYAFYRFAREHDASEYSIMHDGPVLGWHPLTKEMQQSLPNQLPYQAYPVIPYPRGVVDGYFYPKMNCVSGAFIEPGTSLLAMTPAAGNGDPTGTLRLLEMTDVNFVESSSVVRQLQPMEDVPTKGNLNHGVFLSAFDVDGDGLDELIAGQSASEESVGAFTILDFNKDVYEPKRNNFVGFPPGFRGKGNVRVAAADLDGDGTKELVAAADGNGFHLCAIQLDIANQNIKRFVRPTNGVVHVPPLDDWNHGDPIYITAGEFDGNPENGEEILFGLDKPNTTYRIIKFQYQRHEDGTSEVKGINLLQ